MRRTDSKSSESCSSPASPVLQINVPLLGDDLKQEIATRIAMGEKNPESKEVKVRTKFRTEEKLVFGWDEFGSLKPGTCELYNFPKINWRSKKVATVVNEETADLEVRKRVRVIMQGNIEKLSMLILAVAEQHAEVVQNVADAAGASLVHALLIARAPEADTLVYRLCEQTPQLLLSVYDHGEFKGEGILHLVAVSGKQELMISLLQVALDNLRRQELEQLFSQTAKGVFFFKEPMSHFGGTPVSYLAVFGMLDALKALDAKLAVRNFALNVRCPVSGYLPIHAAIVSSRRDIYDYLCDHCGCDEFALVAKSEAFDYEGLAPLHLATKLGLHGIFKHALRRRAVKEWSWGPVTSYMLPMRGIDTEGIAGQQQVMELVVEDIACDDAKMMLDPTFMNGFIYELFLTKWRAWARWAWLIFTALDVWLMVMLTLLASPTILADSTQVFIRSRGPPAITLMLSLLNSEEQMREAFTYLYAHGKNIDTWIEVREAIWHWVIVRVDNWALVVTSLVACVELLASDDPATTMVEDRIRIMFSLSALFAWLQFFSTIFAPFENFNVFVLMVAKMVQGDIFLWFAIALPLTFAFTTATNAVSWNAVPISEDEEYVTTWYHSLEQLTLLALIGLEPVIALPNDEAYANDTGAVANYTSNLTDDTSFVGRRLKGGSSSSNNDETSASLPSEYANLSTNLGVCFMIMYTGFLFIVPLMLVNLLIAMMGNTYSNTIASARLEGRVKFARVILSMELRAFNTPLGRLPGQQWRTKMVERLGRLGDQKEGNFYIHFRSYSMPTGMTHRGAQGDIFQSGVDGDELLPPKDRNKPPVRRFFKSEHRARSFSVSPTHRSCTSPPADGPKSLHRASSMGGSAGGGKRGSLFQQDRQAEAMSNLERKMDVAEESLGERLDKIEEVLQLLLDRDRPDLASPSDDGRESAPSVHVALPPKEEEGAARPAVEPPPPVRPPPSSSHRTPETPKQKPSPPKGGSPGRTSRVSFSEAEAEPPAAAAAAVAAV